MQKKSEEHSDEDRKFIKNKKKLFDEIVLQLFLYPKNLYKMENSYHNEELRKQDLPNASAVLILGILSIVATWCYGIFGLVFAIVALVLAKKDLELAKNDPNKYTSQSQANLKAGKVIAIIGLVISTLFILIMIAYFVFILLYEAGILYF